MAEETQVDSTQIIFRSSKTVSEATLFDYLLACERGTRSLPSMMADLFEADGDFNAALFQFRENPALAGDIQIRVGTFVSPSAGWVSISGSTFPTMYATALATISSSQTAAAASATAAAASAASLSGTSSSSISLGTGSKVFTTQTGKSFGAGTHVVISSNANPTTRYMTGPVTSYSGTTLTVSVSTFAGTGTYTDWTIYVSGVKGADGAPGAAGSGSGDMLKTENLSGLASYPTARGNLGLGTAAVVDTINENNMATNSSTRPPTQASVKAYADTVAAASVTTSNAYTDTAIASRGSMTVMTQNVGTSLTAGTPTTVAFNTEALDELNGHSTSSNTSRFTSTFTGRVHVIGRVGFSSGNNGRYTLVLTKNGTEISRLDISSGSGVSQIIEINSYVSVVSTDYIELLACLGEAETTAPTKTSLTVVRVK